MPILVNLIPFQFQCQFKKCKILLNKGKSVKIVFSKTRAEEKVKNKKLNMGMSNSVDFMKPL